MAVALTPNWITDHLSETTPSSVVVAPSPPSSLIHTSPNNSPQNSFGQDLIPTLQVIGVSKVPSPNNKAVFLQRCLLSDGDTCVWALLHPSMKDSVDTLPNSVVRLVDFSVKPIRKSNSDSFCRLLTITKVEVIVQLGQPLGSPKLLSTELSSSPVNSATDVPSGTSFVSDFRRFYSYSHEFADVTFSVGKELFPAHKVILSARSTYFHALFTNRMQSPSSGPIELEIDPVIFSVILKWIYTDELDLESLVNSNERLENSIAWHLWMSSNYLCLHSLLSLVEQHLISSLNCENVCYFWNNVQRYEAALLQQACKDFFMNNLKTIVDTPGFNCLDKKNCP